MIDKEQLEILKRFAYPTPTNTLLDIARDYGTTPKEIRARVRSYLKQLIEYYEVKEGLR